MAFFLYAPFILLLLSIATIPLIAPHFWGKNSHKATVTAILSMPIMVYLVMQHPLKLVATLEEYVSFILLLASLYIISGGVLITGDLRATPARNTLFLLIGAILANLVGTTGASMLLIRPLLNSISERKHTRHIPIFFIIIVSNIGGVLTPLGDPPLFLGYLKGVPFLWTFKLWPLWLTAVGLLLGIFYLWDRFWYRQERQSDILRDQKMRAPVRLFGKINLLFLLVVIATVLFQVKTPYRELVMISMIGLSLQFTHKKVRRENSFTFYPLSEVAILFAGIFITMIPLMMLLATKGASFGITKPWQFFWLTGGLSSFLDNAPTYLTFATLAESISHSSISHLPLVAGIRPDLLTAISCGAVFMGANTYIGNGPNFMVKSIAEEQGFKMPHFFEYLGYAGLILLPVFVVLTFLFFI
ncbi:MAG TPA: sodium:proton antiporter [Firmicutes bacterium]|nr:sodium:proton antiporter [Bacillota bacterium]